MKPQLKVCSNLYVKIASHKYLEINRYFFCYNKNTNNLF